MLDDLLRLPALGRPAPRILSQTKGEHDGRWIFANANNTPRVARISFERSAPRRSSRFLTARETTLRPSSRKTPSMWWRAPASPIPIDDEGSNPDVPIRLLQGELQEHRKHDLRSAGYRPHEGRLPGPAARHRHRPRPRRKQKSHGWMFFFLLQQRAGPHLLEVNASPEGQGLHRRDQLEEVRGIRESRQGPCFQGSTPQRDAMKDPDRHLQGGKEVVSWIPRSSRTSSTSCPARKPPRLRRGSHRRATSSAAANSPPHPGVLLRQDAKGHRRQGLRRRIRRHSGAEIRLRAARRSEKARPRAPAHRVRRQRLRLHLRSSSPRPRS
jgi:hypothetical protein